MKQIRLYTNEVEGNNTGILYLLCCSTESLRDWMGFLLSSHFFTAGIEGKAVNYLQVPKSKSLKLTRGSKA